MLPPDPEMLVSPVQTTAVVGVADTGAFIHTLGRLLVSVFHNRFYSAYLNSFVHLSRPSLERGEGCLLFFFFFFFLVGYAFFEPAS